MFPKKDIMSIEATRGKRLIHFRDDDTDGFFSSVFSRIKVLIARR